MEYAVIETGSKQYIVKTGEKFWVEKIDGPVGETVVIDKVALFVNGETVEIGQPYLNRSVEAEIVEQTHDPKKMGMRYEGGSYRHRFGHRQPKTILQIKSFNVTGAKESAGKKES